ncbi:hypothetical protein NE237_028837 [Protea cynaroides]|uniref:MADS-box domain-containing protein n=1 Tax=Protea cynaroides TaxID=273540 RepID=A0A9Q0GR43_9MAGN|nr:hypothetical protein NE237_028837 [Protea cynaroides]
MGRKKVEMKNIDNETSRRVTFSKRRLGLFKKASELSTLCGVEVAIIIFSHNGKVYSFGHPHVDSIVDKFLTQRIFPEDKTIPEMMNCIQGTRVNELNQEMTQLLSHKNHVINQTNLITGLVPINTASSTQIAANNTVVVPYGYDFELEDFELLSSCLPACI